MQLNHGWYMTLALEEATKGLGRTAPNPAVGAVVVKHGEVVGRGYHHRAGTPHAEVHALADAGDRARGATLYVTLEPCNHTGRTPPCTEAVLRAGIAAVVIGMPDPNPRVAGGGAAYLRDRGVAVRMGVLEEQCRELNLPFLHHTATGRPWVIMKAGLSLDGRISFQRGQGGAVTGVEANHFVHQLRDRSDAILIGIETARIDNPSLTTRLEGVSTSRDPLRIVLDTRLSLSPEAHLLRQVSSADTWICCGEAADRQREVRLVDAGAKVVRLPLTNNGRVDLAALLRFLGGEDILSVLVEGGARIHGAFWGQGLVDEVLLFYAPYLIGEQGTPLVLECQRSARDQEPLLERISVRQMGADLLYRALVRRSSVPFFM